jgi:hypothetical protein
VTYDQTRLFENHDRSATRDEVLSWMVDVAAVLGYPPGEDIGQYQTFVDLPEERQDRLLPLLYNRAYPEVIKDVAGPTWFDVLIAAGLLPGNVRRTQRGIQLLANDGCVCLSLGEFTIDNMLSSAGVKHEREVPYPGSNLRSDWKCGDVWIEYFGLAGDASYDARTKKKLDLTAGLGIDLVAIYPRDLQRPDTLRDTLLERTTGAPRVSPTPDVAYEPAPFEYVDHKQRVAARKARLADQTATLNDQGGEREDHLARMVWKNEDGLLHRLDGPAVVWDNGTTEWYVHGVKHRDVYPADIRGATFEWWKHGRMWRENGLPVSITEQKRGWRIVELVNGNPDQVVWRTIPKTEGLPEGWLLLPED